MWAPGGPWCPWGPLGSLAPEGSWCPLGPWGSWVPLGPWEPPGSGSQNPFKIKTKVLDPKVLWGMPGCPWVPQMAADVAKMEPPFLPNKGFGTQRDPLQHPSPASLLILLIMPILPITNQLVAERSAGKGEASR